jgi:hypothetical protein
MPTIEIRLSVPEGTDISIVTQEADVQTASSEDVERYWLEYLSGNARKIYWAAARIEMERGPGPGFTLEDIASNISQTTESVEYETVRSFHRTSGRTAKRWRDENGTDEPIRLIETNYGWDEDKGGMRTAYRLPPGVAAKINAVAVAHADTINTPPF